MYKAYVKGDSLENPEVISDLASRLGEDVSIILTDKNYTEIVDTSPFLYYRNPYIRFDYELDIIKLHAENGFGRILTSNNEVVSVNPFSAGDFHLHSGTYYFEPSVEPLPILIGTHRRPEYLKFTLNSVLYSLQSSKQRVYIVLSDSDEETKQVVRKAIQRSSIHIEAVVSENNLFYGWVNFIAKFFDVGDRAVLFDEDVIVPENLKYHFPFWTSQFNYRLTTADIAALS